MGSTGLGWQYAPFTREYVFPKCHLWPRSSLWGRVQVGTIDGGPMIGELVGMCSRDEASDPHFDLKRGNP